MAGSEVSNARAICSVVKPPTARSASAACADGGGELPPCTANPAGGELRLLDRVFTGVEVLVPPDQRAEDLRLGPAWEVGQ